MKATNITLLRLLAVLVAVGTGFSFIFRQFHRVPARAENDDGSVEIAVFGILDNKVGATVIVELGPSAKIIYSNREGETTSHLLSEGSSATINALVCDLLERNIEGFYVDHA